MESKLTAAEAQTALHDAEATRATLAERIVTPAWFSTTLGAAIAAQIAATAVGLATETPVLVAAGVLVFALVAGVQLLRFRRANGVWLGGFASRVVLGTSTATSLAYAAGLGAAIWAGYAERWWLVAVAATASGAAYALGGRRWMHAYRAEPATHGRGESAAILALLAAVAVGGLALLVLNA